MMAPMVRLLLSLLLVSPVWLLPYIPLPGVDAAGIRNALPGTGPLQQLSVGALGLTTVIGAFQLVELVALAVPRLRWRRLGGREARRPLTVAALLLAACIGLVQSFFVCRWLEAASLDPMFGVDVLGRQGWAFYAPAMLALVGGVAVLVGCAHAIGRWALGNGYSLVLAAAAGSAIVEEVKRHFSVGFDQAPPGFLLLGAAGLAALVWGCVRLSRGALSRPFEIAAGLRLAALPPTSGLHPLALAASLLMLPVQLANLGLPIERLTERLVPGSTEYLIGELVLVAGTSLLLSLAFYPPGIVLRFFEALCGKLGLTTRASRPELAGELRRSALHSVALLCAIPLLRYFLGRHLPVASLLEVVLLSMVVVDLGREWRARRADPTLVPAFELHRVYAVGPVRDLLEARGIPVALRGLGHRRLLFFFGPFVPVEVLVPRARAEEARELIAGWTAPDRR